MGAIEDFSVLVVDDEPDLGELVAFEFELVGAKVFNATNGIEALELVDKHDIDVVVSDIRMPGGDGIQLLKNLKRLDLIKPSLVFMTGFADLSLEDAYDKGASAMFGKPFDRNELIETVKRSVLPPEERWGLADADASGSVCFSISFPGLEEAVQEGHFKFGSGGFFVTFKDSPPGVANLIKFKVKFENGDLGGSLEGDGIVRWVRRGERDGLHRGVGIEICNIVGDNRNDVIEYVKYCKQVAFIPKG